MSIRSFEDLQCYQACKELRVSVKQTVKTWPAHEKYDLISQIVRSARSSCANIAEGYGRNHSKDNARFCRISLGSTWETLNHLIDANESDYLSDEELEKYRTLISRAVKLTSGYMRYLNSHDELREPKKEYTLSNEAKTKD